MKKIVSIILFACIWVVPLTIFLALSYVGENHPLEGKYIQSEQFLSDSDHDIEILFFGYSECPHVCPGSLSKVSAVLKIVNNEKPSANVGARFFDVNTTSSLDRADEYSQFFSEHIKGAKLSSSDFEELRDEFALKVKYNAQNPMKIFHTDYFFILVKEKERWKIGRVISNDIKQDEFKRLILQWT